MGTPDNCQLGLRVFYKRSLVLFFCVCSCYFLPAQGKTVRDSLMTYYQQIKFVVHAPGLLPGLAAQERWTEMKNFLGNWSNEPNASKELIFSLEMLLTIQNDHPAAIDAPCDVLLYLSDYSKELKSTLNDNGRFKYFVQLSQLSSS